MNTIKTIKLSEKDARTLHTLLLDQIINKTPRQSFPRQAFALKIISQLEAN